jgi:hypothetical protein
LLLNAVEADWDYEENCSADGTALYLRLRYFSGGFFFLCVCFYPFPYHRSHRINQLANTTYLDGTEQW